MMEHLSTIEDYTKIKLVRKIASGGMGTVYEAIQFGTNGFQKRMALKTLIEEVCEDQEFVELFIGEAKLVADLVHDNIAQVYQLGNYKSTFYIAMEYIHGVNLQDFYESHIYNNTPIPMQLSCFIISRVCRALDYAHNKRDKNGKLLGVVHRDISPKNIMLSFEGVVKLTDFGIAKARNLMLDEEGEVLYGKVAYMSPEQAAFKETDGRSDIFSLGICLYELLAGEVLFGNEETIVTMDRVTKGDIPPIRTKRPDIHAKLEEIVQKALKPDRENRFQSAQEMCYALEHFMYDGGYGPTNLTLEKYLKKLYPEKVRF